MSVSRDVSSLARFSLTINPDKLSRYLLNPYYPTGGPKAMFFIGLGFTAEAVSRFADAIVDQARAATRVTSRPHPRGFGIEISAVGLLRNPAARSVTILTAWNWQPDQAGWPPIDERIPPLATFVSAYPLSELS